MTHIAPSNTDSLHTWLSYWASIHVTAIDLGLERVLPVAHALNILEPAATVFTVAGTNGKGSTTTTLASILQHAGYQVGLYQSPHIFQFNERIKLNDQSADDQCLIDAFVEVERARQTCNLTLSFFEATTLAAFYIFKQQGCDVWVLEVGLGGRLDVVNIIDPDVAVITNIGLDHVDWLGDTVEKIAFEKAGIIRPQIPVIFAGDQTLPDAVAQKVKENAATLYQYKTDYQFELGQDAWCLATPALTLHLPLGQLAPINQAGAVMAALASDLNITETAIRQGIQYARLAGRFEQRQFKHQKLILDVAHNPHGVEFLKQQLKHYLAMHPEISQVNAVFSMLEDKDIEQVVQLLSTVVKQWYIAPLHVQRASPVLRLKQALISHAHVLPEHVVISETITESFQQAMQEGKQDHLTLVCGSFHTLEAVWECLTHGDE